MASKKLVEKVVLFLIACSISIIEGRPLRGCGGSIHVDPLVVHGSLEARYTHPPRPGPDPCLWTPHVFLLDRSLGAPLFDPSTGAAADEPVLPSCAESHEGAASSAAPAPAVENCSGPNATAGNGTCANGSCAANGTGCGPANATAAACPTGAGKVTCVNVTVCAAGNGSAAAGNGSNATAAPHNSSSCNTTLQCVSTSSCAPGPDAEAARRSANATGLCARPFELRRSLSRVLGATLATPADAPHGLSASGPVVASDAVSLTAGASLCVPWASLPRQRWSGEHGGGDPAGWVRRLRARHGADPSDYEDAAAAQPGGHGQASPPPFPFPGDAARPAPRLARAAGSEDGCDDEILDPDVSRVRSRDAAQGPVPGSAGNVTAWLVWDWGGGGCFDGGVVRLVDALEAGVTLDAPGNVLDAVVLHPPGQGIESIGARGAPVAPAVVRQGPSRSLVLDGPGGVHVKGGVEVTDGPLAAGQSLVGPDATPAEAARAAHHVLEGATVHTGDFLLNGEPLLPQAKAASHAVVALTKPAGGAADPVAIGWNDIAFNTIVSDDTGLVSSIRDADGAILLVPGTYHLSVTLAGDFTGDVALRIVDLTSNVLVGQSGSVSSVTDVNTALADFSVSTESWISVQVGVEVAGANTLGEAVSTGVVETYALADIWLQAPASTAAASGASDPVLGGDSSSSSSSSGAPGAREDAEGLAYAVVRTVFPYNTQILETTSGNVWHSYPLNTIESARGPEGRIAIEGTEHVAVKAGHYHILAYVPVLHADLARVRLVDLTRGGAVVTYGTTIDNGVGPNQYLTIKDTVTFDNDAILALQVFSERTSTYLLFPGLTPDERPTIVEFTELADPRDAPLQARTDRTILREMTGSFNENSGTATLGTSSWNDRALSNLASDAQGNVLEHDPAEGTVVLGPGEYHIEARCSMEDTGNGRGFLCRLGRETGGNQLDGAVILGTSISARVGVAYSHILGRVTLVAARTKLRLQYIYYTGTVNGRNLGRGAGGSEPTIAAELLIARVDAAAPFVSPHARIAHAQLRDDPTTGLNCPNLPRYWSTRRLRSVHRDVDDEETGLSALEHVDTAAGTFTLRANGTYFVSVRAVLVTTQGSCRLISSATRQVHLGAKANAAAPGGEACIISARVDVPPASDGETFRVEVWDNGNAGTAQCMSMGSRSRTEKDLFTMIDVWRVGASSFSAAAAAAEGEEQEGTPPGLASANSGAPAAVFREIAIGKDIDAPVITSAGWTRRILAGLHPNAPPSEIIRARRWAQDSASVRFSGAGDAAVFSRSAEYPGTVFVRSPGCYEVHAIAPISDAGGARARLVDAATGEILAFSMSGGAGDQTATVASSTPPISARFTTTVPVHVALEAYASNDNANGAQHGTAYGREGTDWWAWLSIEACPRESPSWRGAMDAAVSASASPAGGRDPRVAELARRWPQRVTLFAEVDLTADAGDTSTGWGPVRAPLNRVDVLDAPDQAAGRAPIFVRWGPDGDGDIVLSRGVYSVRAHVALIRTERTRCRLSEPGGSRRWLVSPTVYSASGSPIMEVVVPMAGTLVLPDAETRIALECLCQATGTTIWHDREGIPDNIHDARGTVAMLHIERLIDELPSSSSSASSASSAETATPSPSPPRHNATWSLAPAVEFAASLYPGATDPVSGPAATDDVWSSTSLVNGTDATSDSWLSGRTVRDGGFPVEDRILPDPSVPPEDPRSCQARSGGRALDPFDVLGTCGNGTTAGMPLRHPSGRGFLVPRGTFRVRAIVQASRAKILIARLHDLGRGVPIIVGNPGVAHSHASSQTGRSVIDAVLSFVDAETHVDLEVAQDDVTDSGHASGVLPLPEVFTTLRFDAAAPSSAVLAAVEADGVQGRGPLSAGRTGSQVQGTGALSYGVALAMSEEPGTDSTQLCTGGGTWDEIRLDTVGFRVGRKVAVDPASGRLVLERGVFNLHAAYQGYNTDGFRLRLRDVSGGGPGDGSLDPSALYSTSASAPQGGLSSDLAVVRGLSVEVTRDNATVAVEVHCETASAAGSLGMMTMDLGTADIFGIVEVAEVGANYTDYFILSSRHARGDDVETLAKTWNPVPFTEVHAGNEGGSFVDFHPACDGCFTVARGWYRVKALVQGFRVDSLRARVVRVDTAAPGGGTAVIERLMGSMSAFADNTGQTGSLLLTGRVHVADEQATLRLELYTRLANARGILYGGALPYYETGPRLEMWREAAPGAPIVPRAYGAGHDDADHFSSGGTGESVRYPQPPMDLYAEETANGVDLPASELGWERRRVSLVGRAPGFTVVAPGDPRADASVTEATAVPATNVTAEGGRGSIALRATGLYRISTTSPVFKSQNARVRLWSDTFHGDTTRLCTTVRADDQNVGNAIVPCLAMIENPAEENELSLATYISVTNPSGLGVSAEDGVASARERFTVIEVAHLRGANGSAVPANSTDDGARSHTDVSERDGSCLFRVVVPPGASVATTAGTWDPREFNQLGLCPDGFALDPPPSAGGGDMIVPAGVYDVFVVTGASDQDGSAARLLVAPRSAGTGGLQVVASGVTRNVNYESTHRHMILYTLNTTAHAAPGEDVLVRLEQYVETGKATGYQEGLIDVPTVDSWIATAEFVPRDAAYEGHFVMHQRGPADTDGPAVSAGFNTRQFTNTDVDDTGVRRRLRGSDGGSDGGAIPSRWVGPSDDPGSAGVALAEVVDADHFILPAGVYRYRGFLQSFRTGHEVPAIADFPGGLLRDIAFGMTGWPDSAVSASTDAILIGTLVLPRRTELRVRQWVDANNGDGMGRRNYDSVFTEYGTLEFWKVATAETLDAEAAGTGPRALRVLASVILEQRYLSGGVPVAPAAVGNVWLTREMNTIAGYPDPMLSGTELVGDGGFRLPAEGLYRVEIFAATAKAHTATVRLVKGGSMEVALMGSSTRDSDAILGGGIVQGMGVIHVHDRREPLYVQVNALRADRPNAENAGIPGQDEVVTQIRVSYLGDDAPAFARRRERSRRARFGFFAQVGEPGVDAPTIVSGGTWGLHEINVAGDASGNATTLAGDGSGAFSVRPGTWHIRVSAATHNGGFLRVRVRSLNRTGVEIHGLSTYSWKGTVTFTSGVITVDDDVDAEFFVVEQYHSIANREMGKASTSNEWSPYVFVEVESVGGADADHDLAIVSEVQPSGAPPGVEPPGSDLWSARRVNNVTYDPVGMVSLLGDGIFELSPGRYHVTSRSVLHECRGSNGRIIDISAGRTVALAVASFTFEGEQTYLGVMDNVFTVESATQVKIESFCQRDHATTVQGSATSVPGVDEIYGIHEFRRLRGPAEGRGAIEHVLITEEYPDYDVGTPAMSIPSGGWVTRPMTHVHVNDGGALLDLDISSSIFTVKAGHYRIHATSSCYGCNSFMSRLFDMDRNAFIAMGTTAAGGSRGVMSELVASVTIERTSRLILQVYTGSAGRLHYSTLAAGVTNVAARLHLIRYATDDVTGELFPDNA